MKSRSKLAGGIPASGIKAMQTRARSLPDVIHLEIGEPDFTTPDPIIEGAMKAARAGATHYTPTEGTERLRKVIAARVAARWGAAVATNQVVLANGSTQSLTIAMLALLDAGDEVLLPDLGWPNYRSMAYLAGATAVIYDQPKSRSFLPDPDQVRALITPKTKALLLNNPGNPGSAVFPRALVEELVAIAAQHDLYVIADEVYEELVFDAPHVPAATFDRDGRVITVSGFSKTYAMTGWRLGYTIAAPGIAGELIKIASPLFSCPSDVAQSGAEAALAMDPSIVGAMRDSYKKRRDLVVKILGTTGLLPVVPTGALYAMVDVSRINGDTLAIALRLLDEEKVVTTPGDAFGKNGIGLLRVSFATAESDLTEGLGRIVRFAERHAGKTITAKA